MTSLEHALAYARYGYAVFPCPAMKKKPAIKNGLKAASRDPGTIHDWFSRGNANLAILPPADIIVLDFDDAHLGDRWEVEYPELQQAPKAVSPRGGAHYHLMVGTRGRELKTRTKVHQLELDIRGLGRAYLLVPPSRTADGTYHWQRPLGELPAVSDALFAALKPPPPALKTDDTPIDIAHLPPHDSRTRRYVLSALQREQEAVSTARDGNRNDRLNRAAFSLGGYVASEGLSQREVVEALLAAAYACGYVDSDGLNAALNTILSGLKAGMRHPRALP